MKGCRGAAAGQDANGIQPVPAHVRRNMAFRECAGAHRPALATPPPTSRDVAATGVARPPVAKLTLPGPKVELRFPGLQRRPRPSIAASIPVPRKRNGMTGAGRWHPQSRSLENWARNLRLSEPNMPPSPATRVRCRWASRLITPA